jgi:hypothetical protein
MQADQLSQRLCFEKEASRLDARREMYIVWASSVYIPNLIDNMKESACNNEEKQAVR